MIVAVIIAVNSNATELGISCITPLVWEISAHTPQTIAEENREIILVWESFPYLVLKMSEEIMRANLLTEHPHRPEPSLLPPLPFSLR